MNTAGITMSGSSTSARSQRRRSHGATSNPAHASPSPKGAKRRSNRANPPRGRMPT